MAETKIIGIETKVLILETDGNNNHFLICFNTKKLYN